MPPEARKLLVDLQRAMADIREFTQGMNLERYLQDTKCRAAVERKFEIIGEACTRLRDQFPDLFTRLPDGPRIIGFRNRLIHGYDNVDDAIVWDVTAHKLSPLAQEVDDLLA